MKINYQLSKSQVMRLANYFITPSIISKLTILILSLILPIYIPIICLLSEYSKSISLEISDIIDNILVLFISYWIIKKLLPFGLNLLYRKILNNTTYSYIFSVIYIEITETHIKYSNEYMEEIIDITSIISIDEIYDFLIIKTNCRNNLFIPLDAIKDKDIFIHLITDKGNLESNN